MIASQVGEWRVRARFLSHFAIYSSHLMPAHLISFHLITLMAARARELADIFIISSDWQLATTNFQLHSLLSVSHSLAHKH